MADYLLKIEDKELSVDITEDDKVIIDKNSIEYKLLEYDDRKISLMYKNRIFNLYIVNETESSIQFHYKNEIFEIGIEDRITQLLKRLSKSDTEKEREIIVKAPMPGLVLKVQVEIGQRVEPGTPLIILEAMKMENEIRAMVSGVIKAINIREKSAVEKGDILVILD